MIKRKLSSSSVEHQITVELGYCCEAGFWQLFSHVSEHLISIRLGMTIATIRRHRRWYKEGILRCHKRKTGQPLQLSCLAQPEL